MPDKYRVAIVLCDLQGKTGKEAARQLKIPEGTLSSRLRTARGMLAQRLSRYRPLLSGAALAALLSRDATAAAPPAALLSATIKAGPLVAAGQAVAGNLVSAKVASLTEGVLKTMLLNKIKLASVVFLLLSLLTFGAVRLNSQMASEQQTEANPEADPPRVEKKEERKIDHQAITVTGRAVDEKGQPVPEATIFLVSTGSSPDRLLGKITTGKDGRYAFRDAQLPYAVVPRDGDRLESGMFQVFGKAPGHAFAWVGAKRLNIDPRFAGLPEKDRAERPSFFPGEKIELDIRFGPPKKVEGRIVNEKGEPVAGVKLRLAGCDYLNTAGKKEETVYREFEALQLQAITLMPDQVCAVTDDQGRFEFPFVPQDVNCWVWLKHPDYADRTLYTATAETPPKAPDGSELFLKLPLQLTLHSVRTIRVQVRSRKTDQPLAGVRVAEPVRFSGVSSAGTSDKEGQLTLKLPPGKYRLEADPPRESPYIRTYQDLTVEQDPAEQSVTIRQELGCILILKAVDADTGLGVSKVSFGYEIRRFFQQARRMRVPSSPGRLDHPVTDDRGEMQVLVQPGKGRYSVLGHPAGYECDVRDIEGRDLELPAGKTITETFRLRKKQ